LRVFVSSTLDELADERQAVREAVESMRMTPVMFELGARPHPPRSLYRAYLEQSDVFVGLYWERYGWVAPGELVSGLEDEYTLAGNRPKLVYIKSPAPKREARLRQLMARIKSDDEVSYRRFATAGELRSFVADDLAVLLTERFAGSGDGADTPARTRAIGRIPHPLTRLIGREADVTRILGLLDDPENRFLTIFGTGGVGKTRIALEVAERVSDQDPDRVVYVDLSAVTEPSLVISSIAAALGEQERTGASLSARLTEARNAKPLLIVLDNAEQVVGAGPELADLLAGAAGVQLMVTSRRLLNIRGEHVHEVEPLPVPAEDGGEKVEEPTPAVELFLERAAASRPDFRPTDDDLSAIGELTRRLDGLPLAIELASAWVRVMSPRAIVDRMGERPLELLRTGSSDMPDRQRTLRDTISWSYSLLSTDAQTLFALLSVFVGTVDLDAIEHVANPDGRLPTLDLLGSLVDSSLVRPAGDAAEPQFGMLETIREFAAEQLEAGGAAEETSRRHEAYYLELAERGSMAQGTVDPTDWLERFDNFRAVLRRAVLRGDATVGLRMGRALAGFWHRRGWYSEGRDWMKDATAWYTLELWAMAELQEGRAERALRLSSLAERGYQGAHRRRDATETHRRLEEELRAALGARYEPLRAEARKLDFDAALDELTSETSDR
jgi:predicted ATPase